MVDRDTVRLTLPSAALLGPPAAVASIQFAPKWLDVLGGTDPSLLRHLKIRSSARPLTQVRSR